MNQWYGEDYDPDAAPFQLNAGLNDAWYNPETPGQGIFVTVFPVISKVFVAMFMWDAERPLEDVTASLGDPGQRWLTGLGGIQGNTASINLELTSGGVFDSETPSVEQQSGYGTLTLTFEDCATLIVDYNLPGSLMGTLPLQRVAGDNVSLCEDLAPQ